MSFWNSHMTLKQHALSWACGNETSVELSYLTPTTCLLMCDNSFQSPLSSGPALRLSLSPSSSSSSSYAKIHESLARRVTEGGIKVLLLLSHWLKSPRQIHLSMKPPFSQGHIPLSQAKLNWCLRFSTLCLRNLFYNMLKICLTFF